MLGIVASHGYSLNNLNGFNTIFSVEDRSVTFRQNGISADQKLMALALRRQERLEIWILEIQTTRVITNTQITDSSKIILEFSPDNSLLLIIKEREIEIWNLLTNQKLTLENLTSVSQVRFSPDSEVFYVSFNSHNHGNKPSTLLIKFSREGNFLTDLKLDTLRQKLDDISLIGISDFIYLPETNKLLVITQHYLSAISSNPLILTSELLLEGMYPGFLERKMFSVDQSEIVYLLNDKNFEIYNIYDKSQRKYYLEDRIGEEVKCLSVTSQAIFFEREHEHSLLIYSRARDIFLIFESGLTEENNYIFSENPLIPFLVSKAVKNLGKIRLLQGASRDNPDSLTRDLLVEVIINILLEGIKIPPETIKVKKAATFLMNYTERKKTGELNTLSKEEFSRTMSDFLLNN